MASLLAVAANGIEHSRGLDAVREISVRYRYTCSIGSGGSCAVNFIGDCITATVAAAAAAAAAAATTAVITADTVTTTGTRIDIVGSTVVF